MPETSSEAIEHLLTHNVEQVVEEAHLRARLLKGEKLRVKLGIDPTAPDIHLGFAVVLRKLREFQDLGHTIVLVIGDATARIGDPSGRSKTRPVLKKNDIAANEKTYLQQVGMILDRVEVRHNSAWFSKLSFIELTELLQKFTVARILERDDFQKRLKAQNPLGLHELLYPLLQAYDSVEVKADVEIGGTDQTFNLLAGRDLQPHFEQAPQDILTTLLLVGLDGKEKMSKSLGNTVGITEPPEEMFGKLMTIPDANIDDYARLAADWPEDRLRTLARRLKGENPRDIKLEVARDIVALYHGTAAAQEASTEWLRVFHDKELPKDIPTKSLRVGLWDVAELLVASSLASSKTEARHLVAQGGVQQNKTPLPADTKTLTIATGDLLQVGKRKLVRVG